MAETKTEEFILFGSKEQTDVIWQDKENNEYYIHRLTLEMRSEVFRDANFWEKDKRTIIKTEFSKGASLEFLKLLYCIDVKDFKISLTNLLEVWQMCTQYNVYMDKCYKTIKNILDKNHRFAIDRKDINFIDIANFAALTKQNDVLKLLFPHIMRERSLTSVQFNKLNNEFKNEFLLTFQKVEKVIRVVEARFRDERYYLANLLETRKHNNYGMFVHYQGFPSNSDGWVLNEFVSEIGTRAIKQVKDGKTKLCPIPVDNIPLDATSEDSDSEVSDQ